MTPVTINTEHVLRNTTTVFGIALASGAATLATKEIAQRCFGNKNSSKDVLMKNIGALVAGIAVTCSLASRATVMTFPFDQRFHEFHALHLLIITVFDALALKMLYQRQISKFMILGSVGTFFGLPVFAGIDQVGAKILPVAGCLGIITALYPYEKS